MGADGNVNLAPLWTNRRFYFANGMVEFLWVRDAEAAMNVPGRDLGFVERAQDSTASPFGALLVKQDPANPGAPFPGWTYQPDYFSSPNRFHVGGNLAEPLDFCAPRIKPKATSPSPVRNGQAISQVCIYTPAQCTTGVRPVSTTMRQIAQGLGVSTGTLYHYFPSKERILEQLVEELCEQGIADFFAQAPAAENVNERLRIVISFFVEHFRFYQQQLLLWIDFHQHQQRKGVEQGFLQGVWRRTHAQMATYLQLPSAQVDFILVFMDGLLLQCLYDRGEGEAD